MTIKPLTLTRIIFLFLLSWSFASSASVLGIYAGASAGKAEFKNSTAKEDSSTGKAYAGYRFLGPLALEVARVDLGEYGTTPVSIDGTSADLVLYLPAGPINVFAKVGVFSWNVDYNGVLPSDDGIDSKQGFGVEYNLLLNLDLRLEWERYTGVGGSTLDSDIDMISAGVNIVF